MFLHNAAYVDQRIYTKGEFAGFFSMKDLAAVFCFGLLEAELLECPL